MGSLIIAFNSPGRKPVSVVTVNDPELLVLAARIAVLQAEEKAADEPDPVFARLQLLEVSRVREALEVIVPGFSAVN